MFPTQPSIFAEMSKLALEHDALNLGQGFPSFEGPAAIKEAAARLLVEDGHQQYVRMAGHLPLCEAIASHQKNFYGLELNAGEHICVTAGATEGLAATILGLAKPGDRICAFEPFYECYPALVSRAGAHFQGLRLRAPRYELDREAFLNACEAGCDGLILNTPHNPTGKVFDEDELNFIAECAAKYDFWICADEVYEHLTFEGRQHRPIASLANANDRTVSLGSFGKTFSMTGWKIGWASGPSSLMTSVRAAHQFLTFCQPKILQEGAAHALNSLQSPDYLQSFVTGYNQRRKTLCDGLRELGFDVPQVNGAYFALATNPWVKKIGARRAASILAEKAKVVAIPCNSFYIDPLGCPQTLRFAFCKDEKTIQGALKNLKKHQALFV